MLFAVQNPPLWEKRTSKGTRSCLQNKFVATVVSCVSLISDPEFAESVLRQKADLVMIGRELLNNPNWVHHAALQFGVEPKWPPQYAWGLDLLRKRRQST